MDVKKITYEDKEAIQNDETIAEKNKITANDMNQIKKAINNNADILTEEKNKVDKLNEDNSNNKDDIEKIQEAQKNQDTNIQNLSKIIKANIEKVAQNTKDITANKTKIEENTKAIEVNAENIAKNSESIAKNSKSIEKLTAENTALKEELERQKEDNKLNGLTEDNEGELLHIENTTGARFNSLEICGNDKQDTREGRNLYNVRDTNGQAFNSNLKVDDEDFISLDNYTNIGSATQWLDFRTNPEPKLQANKVYYIVTEIFSVSGNGILGVVTTNADSMGQFAQGVTYHFEDLNAGDIKVATATTREDLSACLTETRSYIQMNAGETGSIEFRISILEDEVTAEDFVYEKYGESPSFNYPSEIKAVENSINLKICNKNFLDIQKNATIEKGGVTVTTDENGVLTLNGTTTTNIYIKLNGKDIADNNISNWKKSCFRKGTYKFTSEVLTTTQAGNINAFLRKDAYETEGQYATLYQLMNAKTKTATANILEDTEAVVYLWIASGITLNNAKLKFQIELDNATDIVVHEEQFFVVPVQQKMLSGDKFIKVNGEWKEMHTWLELFFDGVNRKFNQEATNTSGKYRLLYHISEKVKNCDTTNGTKAYCSNSKLTAKGATYSCNEGFTVSNNIIYIYIDGRTASAINAELQDNQITFYIPLKEDDYKYLDCTEEQIKVLDKIEKEAHTYLNTTNIYTEDEIGAIIKTNTNVDLKSLINNIQEQLIAE